MSAPEKPSRATRRGFLLGAAFLLAGARQSPAQTKAPAPAAKPVLSAPVKGPAKPAAATIPPLAETKTVLAQFDNTPFPYSGLIPKEKRPFLDVVSGNRRGHSAPRGGVYWQDETYNDRRVLVHIPQGFNPKRPSAFVVFFHGNRATLSRDVVERQHLPLQLTDSGINAILLAPQFAYDAQDSSSGRYWQAGHLNLFLKEAGRRAAEVFGIPALRADFDRMPVILIAYSGGYQAAAYASERGGANARLQGLVLLDALYGEEDMFAKWISSKPKRGFFFSAFTASSRPNNLALQKMLSAKKIPYRTQPAAGMTQGAITFIDAGAELSHDDFVTKAWVENPVAWILSQIPDFARKPT